MANHLGVLVFVFVCVLLAPSWLDTMDGDGDEDRNANEPIEKTSSGNPGKKNKIRNKNEGTLEKKYHQNQNKNEAKSKSKEKVAKQKRFNSEDVKILDRQAEANNKMNERTLQKLKTNEDFNKHIPQHRKKGKPFVLQRTWCFWLGCTSAKYYKPCCKLWQPYCRGLICRRKQKPCFDGWASVGNGCYRVVNVATFEQAKAFCEDDRGSLVEITSKIEQDTLATFYNDSLIHGWVWLGAQNTKDDEWRWISSGEKMIFNSWGNGEPNNAEGEENCIIWNGNKSWKAVRCDYTDTSFKAICEDHKEPLSQTTDDAESVTVGASIKPPKPCYCGIPNRRLRIVGGKRAEKHEYPWQVALVYGYDNTPFCSGSLVSTGTVLTAAHCTQGLEAKDISIVVGEHDITDNSDEQRKKKVKQIIQNNLYNFETIDYDISLLILTNPVKWSKKAKPICLPNQSSNYENVKGIVAGWGAVEYNGQKSDTLLETEVMTMTNTECTTNKRYNSSEITPSMICAAGDGRDACQGDSGGPLISLEAGGYYSVIGVVSWGKGCAHQNSPGVYSRVAHQMSWITDNMVGQTCLIPQPPSSNLVLTGGYKDNYGIMETTEILSTGGACTQSIPPLPVAVRGPQSVYSSNTLMVCGSYRGSSKFKKKCQQLRDSNSQWTEGPAMNIPRAYFSMTKAGQDLYALGGINTVALDSMEKLSDSSGEWTIMEQKLTSNRYYHCTVFMEITRSLVIIGGYFTYGSSTKLVEAFNLATSSWKELAPLPVTLYAHGCAMLGQTIVVTGGRNSGGVKKKVYTFTAGKWEKTGELQMARYFHSMATLDNKILVFGGRDGASYAISTILETIEEMKQDGSFRILEWKLSEKRGYSAVAQVPRLMFPCL